MTKNQKCWLLNVFIYIIHTYITEILKQKVLDLATTWNDPETEDRYALLKEVLL